MENFLFRRSSATAGPDRSARSPRAQESLTVMTAAVNNSGVEEDIIILFFLAGLTGVPLRLVQQAQAFHQQTLRVQSGGLPGGFAFKVDLKAAIGPTQDLEHRLIPGLGTVLG